MIIGIIEVETWQATSALIGGVALWLMKFYQEFLQDRRIRKADSERLQVLRDIAATNNAIKEGQIAQNGKLAMVVETNRIYHEEMVVAVKASCKQLPYKT